MAEEVTRDPHSTYKVKHEPLVMPDALNYSVTRYHDEGWVNATGAGMYRYDALPEWIRDAMRKLDVAGDGTIVPYFGLKRGDTYWMYSKHYYEVTYGER